MLAESVGAIVTSLAAGLAVTSLSEFMPAFARKLAASAAHIQFKHQHATAEVMEEEWVALIDDRGGNLLKLYTGFSLFVWSLLSIVTITGRKSATRKGRADSRGLVQTYLKPYLLLSVGSLVMLAFSINISASHGNAIPWWIASGALFLLYLAYVATSWSRKMAAGSLVFRINRQADRQLKEVQNSSLRIAPALLHVSPHLAGDYKSIADILDNPAQQKRVAIIGGPGTGKTSLLYEIARQSIDRKAADGSFRVPFLLRASDWRSSEETLTQWVTNELSYRFRLKKSTAYALILQGGVLLFLDGLDEVPHPSLTHMARLLNDGLDGCKGLSVISTCRADAFKSISSCLENFSVVNVAPLTDAEIAGVLGRLSHQLDTSSIKLAFSENETTAQAARNPLLLRLLIYSLSLREFDFSPSADPALVALALGNDLAERGETEEALRVFNATAGGRTSLSTTLADILSARVLARLGRGVDADLAFERAKSKYGLLLENLPKSSSTGIEIDENQQRILRRLRMGVSYDVSQIASSALLPPGAVQRALSALNEAGLIVQEDEPRKNEDEKGVRWRLTEAALPEKTML